MSAPKIKPGYTRPIDFKRGRVELAHGSGGRAMAQLVQALFVRAFTDGIDNPGLAAGNDHAELIASPEVQRALAAGARWVMATDGHVVHPLFFPGGDIGCLSVHGTINDVAMSGATPLALSASFILEEGLPLVDLQRIVLSMAQAAREAGVPIVTGDTKVVQAGKADGVFITTTGVGVTRPGIRLGGDQAQVGDKILISGTLGDHGVAIMSLREGLSFGTDLQSDTQALHRLVAALLDAVPDVHVLRDPTRGGVGTTLNEIATQSGVGMQLFESALPLRPEVRAACELLGLDPLYVANEGKMLVICPAHSAAAALSCLRAHPQGRDAAIIGEVRADPNHFVTMETVFGGQRMVDWLAGEQLPRIC